MVLKLTLARATVFLTIRRTWRAWSLVNSRTQVRFLSKPFCGSLLTSKMRPNLGEMRVQNPSFRSTSPHRQKAKSFDRSSRILRVQPPPWTLKPRETRGACAGIGMADLPRLERGACGFESRSAHQCVCGVNGKRTCLKNKFLWVRIPPDLPIRIWSSG